MTPVTATSLMDLRNSVLSKNNALSEAAGIGATSPTGAVQPANNIGDTFGNMLEQVSEQQKKAETITTAYEMGQTNDIVGVMMERHKASVGFESTLQVRNKLLGAYRDIMNMPV